MAYYGKNNNKCLNCIMRSSSIKVLNETELVTLCDNSVNIQFKKGELIIKQGAFTTNVVFIQSGLIKIHLKGPLERDGIMKIEKGPIFAGISAIFADRTHKYSVTALEDCDACFIDITAFREFIEHNGKFALEIIKILSNDLVVHFRRCVNKTQNHSMASFAEALLFFSDYIFESDDFQLPLTRSELGEFIGTTRETITRMIHDLSQDRIIQVNSKSLQILNKNILYKISNTTKG